MFKRGESRCIYTHNQEKSKLKPEVMEKGKQW